MSGEGLCRARCFILSHRCGSSTWCPVSSLLLMLHFWVLTPVSVTITSYISHNPPTRTFYTCFPTCGDFSVVCLSLSGRIISALPRLCVLDISYNALLGQEGGGAGFGQLASSLSHTATLNTLRLQACGLTVDSLGDLGKFSVILDIFCPLLVRILPLEWKVLAGFGGFGFKWLDYDNNPRPVLCCRGRSSLPPGSERVRSVI